MKNSKAKKVNKKDFIDSLVLAVLMAVLSSLYGIIQKGDLPSCDELKSIGILAIETSISYILLSFMKNSAGEIMKKETN